MTFKRNIAGLALTFSMLIGAGGVFASQSPEYDRISDDVASLRELELLRPLDIEVQTRAELQEWIAGELETYPEDEQVIDQRILILFGFIEPGTDVGDLEGDILGEQIAGFYDPETQAMVVVVDNEGAELTANDELTFAHEVVHALQDQHFDLMDVQGDIEAIADDEYLALKSLIEGDATVGQVMYLLEYPELLDAVQDELGDYESPSLDAAPLFYSETLLFPYDQGATFVAEIYGEGGWDAVDAMYASPPVSTEQVLHPEKYLDDEEPVDVTLASPAAALGEGWEILDENVMGEFLTDVFLRNGGARKGDARDASEGWGGDAYIVVGNADETAFTWTSTWDSEDDADEFFNVLVGAESRRLEADVETIDGESHIRLTGGDYVGEIMLDGDTVTYTLAETTATLDAMTGN